MYMYVKRVHCQNYVNPALVSLFWDNIFIPIQTCLFFSHTFLPTSSSKLNSRIQCSLEIYWILRMWCDTNNVIDQFQNKLTFMHFSLYGIDYFWGANFSLPLFNLVSYQLHLIMYAWKKKKQVELSTLKYNSPDYWRHTYTVMWSVNGPLTTLPVL